MSPLVPPQAWHAEGLALHERMKLMRYELAQCGWRIWKRPKWSTHAFKGTSMTFHPLRLMVTRVGVDLEDDATPLSEATLFAHEMAHVLQGAGSRVLWTLRYLLFPGFRRAVEEEAFAHGMALALAAGHTGWHYKDPAVLRRLYLLKRDESTAERVHRRARDLIASGAGGSSP
jgi:hypothetical protein